MAGASFTLNGVDWFPNGGIVTNLLLGPHLITFTNLAGWITPNSQPWTLPDPIQGLDIVASGVYSQVSGVQCDIEPPAAVADGAQWRINDGGWTNSGVLLQPQPGDYLVEFKTINGWTAPLSQNVVVTNQLITNVRGTYYRFNVIGGTGTSAGYFRRPRSVLMDSLHRLHVADSLNDRIQIRDPRTDAWTVLGGPGTSAGQFSQPIGLAVATNNDLYVVDSGNNRIQRYNRATGTWTVWGGLVAGSGQGQFSGPFDVAVDNKNNVYVADLYNNRVQKMNAAVGVWSTFVTNGFTDGFVKQPRGLTIGTNRMVVVASHNTSGAGFSRIQRFANNSLFIDRIGSSYAGQGQLNRPRGMCYRLNKTLYAADTENNRVVAATNFPGGWGTVIGGNSLSLPEDVAYDPRDNLIIADTGNDRILSLGLSNSTTNLAVACTRTGNPTIGFTITWNGVSGWLYAVQYSLPSPIAWYDLSGCTNLPGINGSMSRTDTDTGGRWRLYRVTAY